MGGGSLNPLKVEWGRPAIVSDFSRELNRCALILFSIDISELWEVLVS